MPIFRNGSRILIVVFSILFLFSLSSSAMAGKKKKRRKKPKVSRMFVLDAGLDIRYDDNVINYSDDDLDLYEDGAKVSKFSIKSEDDFILVPRVEPQIRGKFIGKRSAWLKLAFQYYFYSQNDVKRYYKLGLSGRHYISRTAYAEAEYSYIPTYYYRNEFFRDGFGNNAYMEADFSKHYLKFGLGMNVVRSIKTKVLYGYQNKSYNQAFSERDLAVNRIRFDGIWKASKQFKFWSYWGLERAEAKGADIDDLDIKDVSYDAWDITFGGRYYSRLLKKYKPELVSTIKYRQIKYQTTKYRDKYRFGREDSNYYLRVGLAGNFPQKIRIEADYNLITKRVGSLFDSTKISELEYSSNSISIKIKRRF